MEAGNPGIVAAINRRVYCKIQESSRFSIKLRLDNFGIYSTADFNQQSLEWTSRLDDYARQILKFSQKAIEWALNFLPQYKTFKLRTWGNATGKDGLKFGFGTSAAAVVAIVGAILKFHGIDISTAKGREIVFKLASIAHFQAQGHKGSGLDVAASTWGGIILYRRFDPAWLEKQMKKSTLKEIIEQPWLKLQVEQLPLLPRLHLVVGWTRSSASTEQLVDQVSKKDSRIAIYDKIAQLVTSLLIAWKTNKEEIILELIKQNEILLRELGEQTGVSIETPALRKMSDMANHAGAAGKLSGAGGGDCGLAVTFTPDIAYEVRNTWIAAGIKIIHVEIDERGIS